MLKILTIVGARPQFIKAAALSHAITEHFSDAVHEDILHTGQHYDDAMSEQFFTELDIPRPAFNLNVGSGPHGAQTARMLAGTEEVLTNGHYDGVVVYGDTNSTLAGALAAAKLHIPVYHIEAGLRSFNRDMPEEINRVVTDHISTLLFAPTHTAVANLEHEGFDNECIIFSGDIMLDNVLHYANKTIDNGDQIILATVHRDFNTDSPERLTNILSALDAIGKQYSLPVIFPVHPRTKKAIEHIGGLGRYNHIQPVQPLSYLDTQTMLHRSQIVLTDSGGLQKEAFFCGKPCVILRPETEWTEIVDAGAAITADADPNQIISACKALWNKSITAPIQFGDGHAALKILEAILQKHHCV